MPKKRAPTRFGLAGSGLLLALLVCWSGSSIAATAPEPAAKLPVQHPVIALMGIYAANAFAQTIARAAQREADVLGAQLIYSAPSTFGGSNQVPILDALLARRANAIIVDLDNSTELNPTLRRIKAAGIPIINIDNATNDLSLVDSFIGVNGVEAGKVAGQAMGKLIHGKGKVGVIGVAPGNETSEGRINGFLAGLKGYPGISVVATEYAGESQAGGASAATALLTRYPDLRGVFCATGIIAGGAGRAVVIAGEKGKVIVVGFDAPPPEVKLMREGIVSATVMQQPRLYGKLSVEYAYDEVEGKASLVKKLVHPPAIPATAADIDSPEIRKFWYTFGEAR